MTRLAPIVLALSLAACGGGEPVSGAAAPAGLIAAHTRAPDFEAQDQEGRTRRLAEWRGRPVVLYFYPRDATPGCTAEACAFRDAWDRLQAAGAVVVGVSTDDVASHAAFAAEHQLPFPLLADPDETITRRYGVPMRLGMAMRTTFLIDGDGVVRRVFEEVDPGVHAEEILGALDELQLAEP